MYQKLIPPNFRNRHEKPMISFQCSYVHESEKAWLVQINFKQHWIPKSHSSYEKGSNEIEIAEWLCIERGIENDGN